MEHYTTAHNQLCGARIIETKTQDRKCGHISHIFHMRGGAQFMSHLLLLYSYEVKKNNIQMTRDLTF